MPSVTDILKSLEDAVKQFNEATGSNNAVIVPKEDAPVVVEANTDPVVVETPVVESNTAPVVVDAPVVESDKKIEDVIAEVTKDFGHEIRDFIKKVDDAISKVKPLKDWAEKNYYEIGDGTNPFGKD